MAWRDDDVANRLQRVTPRLARTDIEEHRRVLSYIRQRGLRSLALQ
jgi:hypothetical protein